MSEVNEKTVETKPEEGKTEQTNVTTEPKKPENEGAKEETKEKKSFGKWIKKHWKGVAGSVAGVGAAVGSAVLAYKKGKAAGVAGTVQYYEQPQEVSPLDPNVE